jgi:hypothetical protein
MLKFRRSPAVKATPRIKSGFSPIFSEISEGKKVVMCSTVPPPWCSLNHFWARCRVQPWLCQTKNSALASGLDFWLAEHGVYAFWFI